MFILFFFSKKCIHRAKSNTTILSKQKKSNTTILLLPTNQTKTVLFFNVNDPFVKILLKNDFRNNFLLVIKFNY